MSKWIYPLGIVIAIIVIAGAYFLNQKSSTNPSSKIPGDYVSSDTIKQSKLSYNCQSGKTAYELLSQQNKVDYKGSSFGRMVTGINGVAQGNGKYWLYLINGRDATISADAYVCQGDEQIQWELR